MANPQVIDTKNRWGEPAVFYESLSPKKSGERAFFFLAIFAFFALAAIGGEGAFFFLYLLVLVAFAFAAMSERTLFFVLFRAFAFFTL
jgi:hypothetical protein